MRDYRIIITPDAIRDLAELKDYIAEMLLAPDTALKYIQTIRREIGGLAQMPARHKCVDQEPWYSRGVRKIIVKNFYVYYRIDDTAGTVYVLNVIYARRDQLKALSRMKLD
ncbi:MAG: type II toxin-antitoxin system RelE/ParE family toxin [Clostridia bacterium]|nr:type II toxin-antitoxin system RelE/ParE family toxin [Clostridia bacterium]